MRPLTPAALLAAVLAWPTALAAPAPFPKPPKPALAAPNVPFEIDFGPLDGIGPEHREWWLRIDVRHKDGGCTLLIGGGASENSPADEFADRLPKYLEREKSLSAERFEKKVVVIPHQDVQDLRVVVFLLDIDKKFTPTVRRLPKR